MPVTHLSPGDRHVRTEVVALPETSATAPSPGVFDAPGVRPKRGSHNVATRRDPTTLTEIRGKRPAVNS
ncbi:hypothetical protein NITHO_1780004 [Nitrolancea hollandica Lb]|uniref:Uncharacterized protein n=1 Tax=Nitrolancea hollandica Lb TaxID=1129897 RepID=I4EEC6_9BACT|nr:hypothetical protein NITHO_1780004 [Nitrolancea hollandica Lb]